MTDHKCWMRPEKMKSARPVLELNEKKPGTEIAAETAAALAASAIVFRGVDQPYSQKLLNGAKKVFFFKFFNFGIRVFICINIKEIDSINLQLFQFAQEHRGTFDGECPFYCSFSGYRVYSLSIDFLT